MKVVWSQEAKNSLSKIYFYILEDSPQNASMVVDKIIELAETLHYKTNVLNIQKILLSIKKNSVILVFGPIK
ncbi:MAG TPA: type II toxin-antitoxin system RelE/ParE family toxin [Flavobacterium sp.]|nr:type II toxin-antitoxin system RelE/ParE family toxin [Flavobacterium sp.]